MTGRRAGGVCVVGEAPLWDGSGDEIVCLMLLLDHRLQCGDVLSHLCSCLTASSSKLLRMAARSRVIGLKPLHRTQKKAQPWPSVLA